MTTKLENMNEPKRLARFGKLTTGANVSVYPMAADVAREQSRMHSGPNTAIRLVNGSSATVQTGTTDHDAVQHEQ
jgi:hypothetical protein